MAAEPRAQPGAYRQDADTSLPQPWLDPPANARQFVGGADTSGFEWHDAVGHWCLLTHVTSGAPQVSNAEQTRLVLERMNALLTGIGLAFGDVVRTWYFLDDILGWYGDFNRERTRFFEQHRMLSRMPASTAVGPSLDHRSALAAGLLAVRPRSRVVGVDPVPSPAQGSAFDYGSSFSRAMEITWPRGKHLYVSGTASIDPTGRTLHPGQMHAQTKEAFRIVGELLASRGLCFEDVARAVCYVAWGEDPTLLQPIAAEYLPGETPWVHAAICRPDLRFELEVIASRKDG